VYDKHDSVRQDLALLIDGDESEVSAVRPEAQIKQTIDIAIVQLNEPIGLRGIPTQLRLPQVGEEVAAIGFPRLPNRNSPLVVHVGIVEALPTNHKETERFIQVSFQSGGGLSGGCLIDKSGHVLGVMTENVYLEGGRGAKSDADSRFAPARPYGQAVPIEYLDAFLHGESLVPPEDPGLVDEPVFDGVPPEWYVKKMREQEKIE
jgi:hypothetical protein